MLELESWIVAKHQLISSPGFSIQSALAPCNTPIIFESVSTRMINEMSNSTAARCRGPVGVVISQLVERAAACELANSSTFSRVQLFTKLYALRCWFSDIVPYLFVEILFSIQKNCALNLKFGSFVHSSH
jgi:hypothetical protein